MADQFEAKDPNKHVAGYLRYYCDADSVLDYAVMLRGPWGSGKTHLINEFLAERARRESAKHLYVSLYGLTSFRQIDDAFFRQLHPILSSKGMKIASAIVRGALKATVKFDLNVIGKDDVTINSQLPDVNFHDYFEKPSECLLVFDDLERCSMPIPEVMGYINALVEHEGFKVIILANEAEILSRKDSRYAEIKEKLIGQTLEVRSTAAIAIPQFLELIKDDRTRRFIKDNVDELLMIYKQSGTENLRILKQSLWSFERLATCFSEEHWKNCEAVTILFRVVLALSFQIRSGSLKVEQLADVQVVKFRKLINPKKGEAADTFDDLEERYPEIRFDQTILSIDLLKELLFKGWADPGEIRRELDRSPFYALPGSEPPWKTAWHIWDIDDDEYREAVAKVEEQFGQRIFEIPGEILQVFGLRLLFSEIGLIAHTKAEVVAQCKKYIVDLRDMGRIKSTYGNYVNIAKLNDFGGLGFYRESDAFDDLRNYYSDIGDAVKKENLPDEGRNLLMLLKSDPQKFFRLLCINDFENSIYYSVPILATIPPEEFVDQVLSLDPRSGNYILDVEASDVLCSSRLIR